MKFLINNAKYGNIEFPYKKVVSIGLGTFGDFEKPYYHRVLWAEHINRDGQHHYEIIWEYFRRLSIKKYVFFGKVLYKILFGFKSKYNKKTIESLIKDVINV